MDKEIKDDFEYSDAWFDSVMGDGEPARLFDRNARVYSNMSVRVAIISAIDDYKHHINKKPLESDEVK